jgi:hypothetical protein
LSHGLSRKYRIKNSYSIREGKTVEDSTKKPKKEPKINKKL